MTRALAPGLLILGVALAFRAPKLADRPMHADEAVLADKFGTLLEKGSYQYDPREYHGPLLAWLTIIPARLTGAHRYQDLTETILRVVPVLCGLILVLAPFFLIETLGYRPAIAAAFLTAVSPAMVYYSRYYIPEMLLTALTFAVIVFGHWYGRTRKPGWALAAGASLGLMFATKETAGIAAVCLITAWALTQRPLPRPGWPMLAAVGVAALIAIAALGPANIVTAVLNYSRRAIHDPLHQHPFYYYSGLLTWSPFICVFAIVGGVQAHNRLTRFLAVYACAMMIAYSAIPYKTPWCLLGILQPMIILAGSGLADILRTRDKLMYVAVTASAGVMAIQAWQASFPYASDPHNPYVYAHTTRDVFEIRDAVERIARANPEGHETIVQVVSTKNLWPLPWYLRGFHRVEWWSQAGPGFHPASVIIATPDMEPGLIHEIYEVPPAGERELYVPLFDRYVEVRPQVEVRGYARASLTR
jgi:predicted membrane-bound mannosyltransferase